MKKMGARRAKPSAHFEEEIVTAPIFVRHYYVIVETRDGEQFYVDRNVLLTSGLFRDVLQDLRQDPNGVLATVMSSPPAGTVNKVYSKVVNVPVHDGKDEYTTRVAYVPSCTDRYPDRIIAVLADGDVEVVVNEEQLSNDQEQLPIIYPLTQSEETALSCNVTRAVDGSSCPSESHEKKEDFKAKMTKQQLQAIVAHEALINKLQQRRVTVDAIEKASERSLTHIILTKINSEQFELALKFMYYKYKNDHICDGEKRPMFTGFVHENTHLQLPQEPVPTTEKRKFTDISGEKYDRIKCSSTNSFILSNEYYEDLLTATDGNRAAADCILSQIAPDPITGAGAVVCPQAFTKAHIMQLSIATLLQI